MTRPRRTVFLVVPTCFLVVDASLEYPGGEMFREVAVRAPCAARMQARLSFHGTLHANTVICVDVHYLNLACCGVEAASRAGQRAARELADIPGPNVAVVAGTVTTAAADIVADWIAGIPAPRLVVAYGVCTIAGGPYWDSYAVVPGIEADVLVPGCPPRPQALAAAVRAALEEETR